MLPKPNFAQVLGQNIDFAVFCPRLLSTPSEFNLQRCQTLDLELLPNNAYPPR